MSVSKKLLSCLKTYKNIPKLCEHFNLGVAYRGLGKIDEEIKCYETTLKIDPNNPEANHNLGLYLLRNKTLKKAGKNMSIGWTLLLSTLLKDQIQIYLFGHQKTKIAGYLYMKQGVGDCIFFASFLPELKRNVNH